ncbi:MAG: hypothetical protein WBP45_09660 [Daejeonella sp.]
MKFNSKAIQYRWPDGSWNARPYNHSEQAKGLLKFLFRIRFIYNNWKNIEVIKKYCGKDAAGMSTGFKLVKKAKWAEKKQGDNYRFSKHN